MCVRQTERTFTFYLVAMISAYLSVNSGRGATQIPNEFWVSTSTNTGNLGTLSDPYDASTQKLFDQVMTKMPPNCTIHLLSGTYQTLGTWQARSGGWAQVKSGQRIVGSGIDHTIIHLCRAGTGSYWFGTPGIASTNIELSDLTIDGAGTTNCDGVWLNGDHIVIRRIKVTNLASQNAEIFAIFILGGPGTSGGNIHRSEGNIIEECEVDLADITWVSAICLSGNSTNYASGMVRNNRVLLGPYKPGLPLAGFNCGYDHDLLVEGNYVEGGNWGMYAEASFTNLMVHHNTFKNVGQGVYLYINGSTNVTCSFNTIELAASPRDAYAFLFEPPYSFKNVTIIGNTIQFASHPALRRSYALYATTVSGVSFLNNVMDSQLLFVTEGSTGINVYNNSDLFGKALAINQDPVHRVARRTVSGSATYLVDSTDRYIGIRNIALRSVSLPPATGWPGKEFVIVREDGGNFFTVLSRGGLINGTNNLAITKGNSSLAASATVISDGTNWYAR